MCSLLEPSSCVSCFLIGVGVYFTCRWGFDDAPAQLDLREGDDLADDDEDEDEDEDEDANGVYRYIDRRPRFGLCALLCFVLLFHTQPPTLSPSLLPISTESVWTWTSHAVAYLRHGPCSEYAHEQYKHGTFVHDNNTDDEYDDARLLDPAETRSSMPLAQWALKWAHAIDTDSDVRASAANALYKSLHVDVQTPGAAPKEHWLQHHLVLPDRALQTWLVGMHGLRSLVPTQAALTAEERHQDEWFHLDAAAASSCHDTTAAWSWLLTTPVLCLRYRSNWKGALPSTLLASLDTTIDTLRLRAVQLQQALPDTSLAPLHDYRVAILSSVRELALSYHHRHHLPLLLLDTLQRLRTRYLVSSVATANVHLILAFTNASLALLDRTAEGSSHLAARIAHLRASPTPADPFDVAALAAEVFHFYHAFYNHTINFVVGRADPHTQFVTFPSPADMHHFKPSSINHPLRGELIKFWTEAYDKELKRPWKGKKQGKAWWHLDTPADCPVWAAWYAAEYNGDFFWGEGSTAAKGPPQHRKATRKERLQLE